MHLVDVCAFYTRHGGGVRTYIDRKLEVLPRLGHRVTVIVPGTEAATREVGEGARLVSLPTPAFPLDRRYRYFDDEARLHRALDEARPDFVEASSPWSSAGMVGRWPSATPRALVMHADPLSAYAYRWLGGVMSRPAIDRTFGSYWRHLRRLNDAFDLAICGNGTLTERMIAGGLTCSVTVPFGVEPGRFSPDLRDEALRAALLARCGLPADATLLLGIGRLAAEKRWSMVIDAVAAVSTARPVGLILVGAGLLHAALTRHIAGNPHVRLVPPVGRDALARLLASVDALVHGSEAETTGLVVAEARASGIPLIVPDEGGAPEHLVAGAGRTYRAGSGASLADALADGLADLPSLHAAALAASRTGPTMDRHFANILRHYERIEAPVAHAA